jgi:hypothetical protein
VKEHDLDRRVQTEATDLLDQDERGEGVGVVRRVEGEGLPSRGTHPGARTLLAGAARHDVSNARSIRSNRLRIDARLSSWGRM